MEEIRDISSVTYDEYLRNTPIDVHKNLYSLNKLQQNVKELKLQAFREMYGINKQLRMRTKYVHAQIQKQTEHIPLYWARILTIVDLNYNNMKDT